MASQGAEHPGLRQVVFATPRLPLLDPLNQWHLSEPLEWAEALLTQPSAEGGVYQNVTESLEVLDSALNDYLFNAPHVQVPDGAEDAPESCLRIKFSRFLWTGPYVPTCPQVA